MAFKRLSPRKGTVIPEHHRPPGSINAALHELPAFREYTHDLIGVVLYLPRLRHVVVPYTLRNSGGAGCVIVEGDETYPRGGYHIDVSDWELQRAERVAIRNSKSRELAGMRREFRHLSDGGFVQVDVEDAIEVEPDPDIRCWRCKKWLTNPDAPVEFDMTQEGPECRNQDACLARTIPKVYRAPVQP